MPNKHALISPSACGRIGYCPASVMLSKDIPNESSSYAEEGTAAHRLCEIALLCEFERRQPTRDEAAERANIVASYADGLAMAGHVRTYVDYIMPLAAGALYRAAEVRLPVTPVTSEPDAFGTADCVVIADDVLHIIDFKYGAGVKVEAKANAQLAVYALAALEALDPDGMLYGVTKVKLHIVQPRMDNIDAWEIERSALETCFALRIRRAAERALKLVAHPEELRVGYPFLPKEGTPAGGDFAEPSDNICRFCRAKAVCPILQKITVETLEQDFEDLESVDTKAELPAPVVEQIRSIPVPDTPERLAAAYGWLSIIRMWADSVEAAMVAQLSTHGETYGYKLVAGRPGPRKWTDAAAAEAELRKALKVDQAYDRKVISPTTAEKLHKSGDIGPKYWARLSNLIGRSDGKPMIVPSTDERPALVPAIENDFENLESENKAE